MRSHPPTLLTLARRTITLERLFERGARVLVAVSGGADSMALLHVLASLRDSLGIVLVAHGVDHGLRPEAPGELDIAEVFAKTVAVPFGRTTGKLAAGGNLQARARALRQEALRRAARSAGASSIATAHHAHDRAETVLIRLLRGAGPAGLAVLPPRACLPGEEGERLDLVRPLIRADRRAIDAHVTRHDIPHSRDPSNLDPRYLRTRVRSELLPLLTNLSPSIVDHLCALADQLVARDGAPDGAREVSAPHMRPLPRATREALASVLRTRSKKARVSLPGGRVATYDQEELAFGAGDSGRGARRPSRPRG